jgi:hypothetical protein
VLSSFEFSTRKDLLFVALRCMLFEIFLGIPSELLMPAAISPAVKLHVQAVPQKYDEGFSV